MAAFQIELSSWTGVLSLAWHQTLDPMAFSAGNPAGNHAASQPLQEPVASDSLP